MSSAANRIVSMRPVTRNVARRFQDRVAPSSESGTTTTSRGGHRHRAAWPHPVQLGRLRAVGLAFLLTFIQFLLLALWAMVLGRMLMSWVDPTGRNHVSAFLIQATEPMLAPVRRMLPTTGMIDWSGLIVLLVLGFLMRAF